MGHTSDYVATEPWMYGKEDPCAANSTLSSQRQPLHDTSQALPMMTVLLPSFLLCGVATRYLL
jgi:hypothetical protein